MRKKCGQWSFCFAFCFLAVLSCATSSWKKESIRESEKIQAVKSINDQSRLADIALNDPAYRVRLAAIEKLTDQQTLKQIVEKDSWDIVREAAANKIVDQEILFQIAQTNLYEGVRIAATKKLTTQRHLFRLIKETPSCELQLIATSMLTDQKLIACLAQYGPEGCKEETLIGQQTISEERGDSAKMQERESGLKSWHLMRLPQQKLAVRGIAISKLNDRGLLEQFTRNRSDTHVSEIAELKLIIIDPVIREYYGDLDLLVSIRFSLDSTWVGATGNYFRWWVEVVTIKIYSPDGKELKDYSSRGEPTPAKPYFRSNDMFGYAKIDINRICMDLLQRFTRSQLERVKDRFENHNLQRGAISRLSQAR